MVRALGLQPLERIVWEVVGDKVFICNPQSLEACKRREAFALGFPREDVFVFDERLFRRLNGAYNRKDKHLRGIWTEAKSYLE
jgi:hypothetical protein